MEAYGRNIIVFLFTCFLAGCSIGDNYTYCSPSGDSIYILAVENQLKDLSEQDFKIDLEKQKICVDDRKYLEMNRAVGRADLIYRGAATLIFNTNQRNRMIQFFDKRERKYEIHKTDQVHELIVVYSSSNSEMEETKKQLDELSK